MTPVDHAYALLIAVIYPLTGFVNYRRLLRRVAAGAPVNRPKLYRATVLSHWLLFLVCLALWAGSGRPWTELGFGLQPAPLFALAIILTIAGIALLLLQLRQVKFASQDEIDAIKSQLGRLSIMLPRNGGELARFYGLSVTAGIVEEALWRGFLIWYFSQFMPLWVAAVVSGIGFGLAHAYQGFSNLPKIIVVGTVFAALFILSGSLWLPMILHAAVDILQGRLAYDVLTRNGSGGSPSADVAGVNVS
jgi:membrane protease YdiL (CAAX protease family)